MVAMRMQLLVAFAGLAVWQSACAAISPQLVQQQQFEVLAVPIQKLAVVLLVPGRALRVSGSSLTGHEPGAREAAAALTRFVSDAIAARGVEVVSDRDMRRSVSVAHERERLDPVSAARLASAEHAATAVLLGQLHRYREREGSAWGALRPASVEFEVTLYAAPSAVKLWTARFGETQQTLSGNLFAALRYPGRGTRFLTVAELARWGATLVAEQMPVGP